MAHCAPPNPSPNVPRVIKNAKQDATTQPPRNATKIQIATTCLVPKKPFASLMVARKDAPHACAKIIFIYGFTTVHLWGFVITKIWLKHIVQIVIIAMKKIANPNLNKDKIPRVSW